MPPSEYRSGFQHGAMGFSTCNQIADTVFTKPQFGLLFSEFPHRGFHGAQMRSEPAVPEHQPVAQASLDPIIIHDMPISVHFTGKNAVCNQSQEHGAVQHSVRIFCFHGIDRLLQCFQSQAGSPFRIPSKRQAASFLRLS